MAKILRTSPQALEAARKRLKELPEKQQDLEAEAAVEALKVEILAAVKKGYDDPAELLKLLKEAGVKGSNEKLNAAIRKITGKTKP